MASRVALSRDLWRPSCLCLRLTASGGIRACAISRYTEFSLLAAHARFTLHNPLEMNGDQM